ncbi:Alpha/Beta hydrolase protein [Aspergillus sergii]|uniref:Alpha/Beta hydrolase protein n=1 Tax=Aspergillus sergii TaxID=1034303 RepID=A0A5N6XBY9_9EURO|nr:Alpha/Beta hydrolase protein [Aspergillus sergii]
MNCPVLVWYSDPSCDSRLSPDAESWIDAWVAAGRKAEGVAVAAEERGDREAARWAWIRSGNYFREAEYKLHCTPKDTRLLETLEHSVRNFQRGFALLADPAGHGREVLSLEVPYEHGLTLPAWARRRGYAVLTFDGPGQGIFHRRLDQRAGFPAQAPEGAYMRHDWEAVIRPVLDRLWTYSEANQHLHFDLNRVSIFSESMGAYFALRGAADSQIKVCIAMDGFYDMWDIADSRIPPVFLKDWDRLGDRFFDRVIRSLGRVHFRTRFEFAHARFALGLPTYAQATQAFQKFSLRGDGEQEEYLARVQCPVFVTGAADWAYFPAQGNATKIFEVFN